MVAKIHAIQSYSDGGGEEVQRMAVLMEILKR